jgi:hypothetical protein
VREGWRALAAAGLLVLLSGCVKADVDLTVRPDDQVDGTIVMAVDRGYATQDGQGQSPFLDALSRRTFQGTRSGARQEPYADDRYVGTRVTLEGMTLLDFDRSTGEDGLKIVHQGGRYQLSGTVDTKDLASAAAASSAVDAQRITDAYEVTIRVTFPGRVVSANGVREGRTVTWRPRFGERVRLQAEAEDGGGGFPWPWLVLGALVVAAGAGLAVLLRRRGLSGSSRTAAEPRSTRHRAAP